MRSEVAVGACDGAAVGAAVGAGCGYRQLITTPYVPVFELYPSMTSL